MLLLLAALGLANEPVFSAGSYGRVQVSSDLGGGGGDAVRVARYAPRLEAGPYMELDLAWDWQLDEGPHFTVLITPALSGNLFHYDGEFAEALALRNFYASASGIGGVPLELWAGSRMYRGDDVYLLDFWPLDNLNTFGGGAIWRPNRSEVALHVGANRLLGDDYQYQTVRVVTPDGVTGEDILFLDRQRVITSLKAHREIPVGDLTLRAKVYGELHTLPEGEAVQDDAFDQLLTEALPSDSGALVGAQLSLWGWSDQSFLHLWTRYATGLAAYGELAIPSDGLSLSRTTQGARSFLTAAMVNHETPRVGVMAATYVSNTRDADSQAVDFDDRWEWVGVARPQVYFGRHVALGVEASHQYVRPNGLNPRSNSFDQAHLTKLSIIPAIQRDRGGYSRPRLHIQYTASFLNDGARSYFNPLDARVSEGVQHFVGIGAEWWVNTRRVIAPVSVTGDESDEE